MSDIHLAEVANLLGIKPGTLRYWLKIPDQRSAKLKEFFFKKTIIREELVGGVMRMRHREMWFIDEKNIEEIKEIGQQRKIREKRRFDKKYSWSRSAIECYQAKYDCRICQNNYICGAYIRKGKFPPMRKIVKEMVEIYGIPPERIIEE